METQAQPATTKRGGAKTSPLHITLIILSTLLLTLAGVFLIFHWNVVGIVTMILGIIVRIADTKIH